MQEKITGLIISAGLSGRMGKLKPLIVFNGKTFLEHIVDKLDQICTEIIIVTGYQADRIKKETENRVELNNKAVLKKITWIHNPNYENGMLVSFQAGLSTAKNSEWILYHFADQPDISGSFYTAFAQQIDTEFDWIQPVYRGKSGHPVLISRKLFSPIINLKADQSLRDLEKTVKFNRKKWECGFKEILQDFDTPQQLEKLKKEN